MQRILSRLGPSDGKTGTLSAIGVRFMLNGEQTRGGFSLVEHPIPPRALAAPLHRHTREDEYSYVLEGELGVQLGEHILYGRRGDLILKPRGQWHTFWNPSDQPARILEIISPAGFEHYFEEMLDLAAAGPPDPTEAAAIASRYRLEFDLQSIPQLLDKHGLTLAPRAR